MAADEARLLAGRRIVITRAPEQAEEIVRRLNELGAQVILLPMVRFAGLEDNSELSRVIARLGEFDWLVFTSVNAVRFFVGRCGELGRGPSVRKLSIAVVGSATRDALEAEGLQAALAPGEFGGAALAAALAPLMADKRVLLPRSDRASGELPGALRSAGAIVTEVVAYRTAEPESVDASLVEIIRQGGADAIAFFSPSAFHNFARVMGVEGLAKLGESTAFAAVGPTTAAAIREAGLPVAVEASTATAEGFTQAFVPYLARGKAETGRIG